MDYEKILKEQMENVVKPGQEDIISDEASRITEGLTDGFTLDKILEATLDGKSIFNSQELINNSISRNICPCTTICLVD